MKTHTIIIYGTKYGSSKRYAERLGELLDVEVVDYREVGDLTQVERIIYIGSLYAGGVLGLRRMLRRVGDLRSKQLVLVTVGLSDPTNPTNRAHIREEIAKVVTEEQCGELSLHHLRGGIDYSHLSLKHRLMMSLLRAKVSRMDASERTAEDQLFLETYGSTVDFVDLDTILPLADALRSTDGGAPI